MAVSSASSPCAPGPVQVRSRAQWKTAEQAKGQGEAADEGDDDPLKGELAELRAPARTTPWPSAPATRFPEGLFRRAPGARDRLKLSAERLDLSSIRAYPLRALGAQECVIVEALRLDPQHEDPRCYD